MKSPITRQQFVALCVLSRKGKTSADVRLQMFNAGMPTNYRCTNASKILSDLKSMGLVSGTDEKPKLFTITGYGEKAREKYLNMLKAFHDKAREVIDAQ